MVKNEKKYAKTKDAGLVDLEKIIRNQKNKLVKNLPGIIVRRIEKLVHQDRINEAIEKDKDKYGVDFIKGNLEYLNTKIIIRGLENVPDEGRFIYACNHPLGGIDFYAAIVAAYEKHPNIKVIANEILMALHNLRTIFLPVSVFSKNGKKAREAIHEVLKSDDRQLMTFPAGEVARKYNGKLDDGKWHPGFIKHAVEYKRDIIPVFINSENSKRFYRLANFRRKIGLKANLELFLLPDELFRKENQSIPVIFGKPVSYKSFTKKDNYTLQAEEIKKIVYDLKPREEERA